MSHKSKSIGALLLAAGYGSRLRPLTNTWPKCLMPIKKIPILEYWLGIVNSLEIRNVLVNRHYHADLVFDFLQRPKFENWVDSIYEERLLGTAGTLRSNASFFRNQTVLMLHADNWCCCDFQNFVHYHVKQRPANTVITMMTFNCHNPSSCGIVEVNREGIVTSFYEKVTNPPGNLANAAVYLIEPEVVDWVSRHRSVEDFSRDVLPHFVGRIATWHNSLVHRDIGTMEMLGEAQKDECDLAILGVEDSWYSNFLLHEIHNKIDKII